MQRSMIPVNTKRIDYLDGVRGWASLVVLFYHAFWETFGKVMPVFRNPWTSFALDGHLAVFVFFVLSGDALSTAWFSRPSAGMLARQVSRRYFRLTIPILMSCLLVYLLMISRMTHHEAGFAAVGRSDWIGRALPFEPELLRCIRYALYEVYAKAHLRDFLQPIPLDDVRGACRFDVGLSVPAHLARAAEAPDRVVRRWLDSFCSLGSFYGLFFVGIGFAWARSKGWLDRFGTAKWKWLAMVVVGCVVVASTWARYQGSAVQVMTGLACAILLVGAIHIHSGLRGMFSGRLSRFLGRVSFPVYLVQFAVLISVTSELILSRGPATWDLASAMRIGLTTVFVTLGVATVFERIEAPILRFVGGWVVARACREDEDKD